MSVHRISQNISDRFEQKLCRMVDLGSTKKWLNLGTDPDLDQGSFSTFVFFDTEKCLVLAEVCIL